MHTTKQDTALDNPYEDELVDSLGFGQLEELVATGQLDPKERTADGTTTYGAILTRHQVEVPAHLEADAEVPVVSGLQRQGDVLVVPHRASKDKGQRVPAEGIAVVRGEAGGNTHLLVADGPVSWRPVDNGGLDLGAVTVEDGSAAYLLHPEHGGQGIGPGSYLIRRQREQADQIRMVQD